eukprot:6485071-Amphidinium_carterae.1
MAWNLSRPGITPEFPGLSPSLCRNGNEGVGEILISAMIKAWDVMDVVQSSVVYASGKAVPLYRSENVAVATIGHVRNTWWHRLAWKATCLCVHATTTWNKNQKLDSLGSGTTGHSLEPEPVAWLRRPQNLFGRETGKGETNFLSQQCAWLSRHNHPKLCKYVNHVVACVRNLDCRNNIAALLSPRLSLPDLLKSD